MAELYTCLVSVRVCPGLQILRPGVKCARCGAKAGTAWARLQLTRMDYMDDIRRRLRVSNLQSKRELLEIERTALLREITSPLTSQDRREEAFRRRDEITNQWTEIVEELQALPH
jgi:hypothetical protein